jgi:hypothetical protein
MDAPTLMQKLIEIDRALGKSDECTVRNLILAAQDGVLQIERENEELALENVGLRHRLNAARQSELAAARAHSGDSPSHSGDAPDPAGPRNATGIWRTTHFFIS